MISKGNNVYEFYENLYIEKLFSIFKYNIVIDNVHYDYNKYISKFEDINVFKKYFSKYYYN